MESSLVYFALLALAFFLLIVRPQRRRVAAHRALVATLEVGDEVITTGGIYGTVRAIEDDAVELEVAPGVRAHGRPRRASPSAAEPRRRCRARPTPRVDDRDPADDGTGDD